MLTKALEVVLTKPIELGGVVPCEGAMHLLMSVFAGIGRLYGDAGLKQLITQSYVYAAGTADMIMQGKYFDRSLTANKVIDEVVSRRLLVQFRHWCRNINNDLPDIIKQDVHSFIETIVNLNDTSIEANIKLIDECNTFLVPLLNEFRQHGRDKSPTLRF